MDTLFFDIETNGLLESVTKVHSLVIKRGTEVLKYRQNNIEEGLKLLSENIIVGHNIIKFDIPVLHKLYPWFQPKEENVVDTIVLSRLIYSNLGDKDNKLIQTGRLPSRLWNSHSLEAFGYRLKLHKGDYVAQFKERMGDAYEPGMEWLEFSQEMEDYCVQDVEVTEVLYKNLAAKGYSEEAIKLEHQVAHIIAEMERTGFYFDVENAERLNMMFCVEHVKIEQELEKTFLPWYTVVEREVIPKASNKKIGFTKDVPYTKIKWNLFNPNSRDHIAHQLKTKRGWKPTDFTDGGKPKVDEKVLGELEYPEAKLLAKYLTVSKRLGQLSEGNQAWLKQVKTDSRIHGSMNTNGAVTGRATHSNPNLGQVPNLSALWGAECRSLFTVPKGKKLVGADLSGLELRCLAHYMHKFDSGDYTKILLEGDVHTANQHAAGLETRNQAKTFIYAFLYGAGAVKIGSIVGSGAKAGQQLKDRFLDKTPALKKLITKVQRYAQKYGYLPGLDGRQLHVRSTHAALNTLLQAAGALISKRALVELRLLLRENNLTDKAKLVAWVHDEFQMECDEDVADQVGKLCVLSFERAGDYFKFKTPITGEYQVGNNWKETH